MKIKRRPCKPENKTSGIQRSDDGRFGIDCDLGVVFEVVNGFEVFQDRKRWEAGFKRDPENPPPILWAMRRKGSRKILARSRFKITIIKRTKLRV